uniref:Uncharacterized protein n=1 Tax=Trichogramma kaykai TaxID=54128 RepID=A0ABD2W9W4_9HYME
MFCNNFEHCQKFVFAFRENLILQVFNPSTSNDVKFDQSIIPPDYSSLIKYPIEFDRHVDDKHYQEYFDLFYYFSLQLCSLIGFWLRLHPKISQRPTLQVKKRRVIWRHSNHHPELRKIARTGKIECSAILKFILSDDGQHYYLDKVEQHQGHDVKNFRNNHRATAEEIEPTQNQEAINEEKSNSSPVKLEKSRSVFSNIENLNVEHKRSVFDVSGHSSPLMFESDSDNIENSPPPPKKKISSQSVSSSVSLTLKDNAACAEEVDDDVLSDQLNEENEAYTYMLPILNPCGRPKGSELDAFGLEIISPYQFVGHEKLHVDIRAKMIVERIVPKDFYKIKSTESI